VTVTVVDDFIDRPRVLPDPRAYLRWQADWIRRLDSHLSHAGAAAASALLIKTPLDSLVDWSRVLGAVVRSLQPSRLLFLGPAGSDTQPWHNGHLQFWPILGDRTLAAALLPLVANHLGTHVAVEEDGRATGASAGLSTRQALRSRAARAIGPWRQVRPRLQRDASTATLMLWSSGYGATEFANERRVVPRSVLALLRGRAQTRLIDTGRPWRRSGAVSVEPSFGGVVPEALSPFLGEVDEWAELPGAGEVLRSRLTAFLGGVVPAVGSAAQRLEGELRRWNVVEVAAANPSSIEEFAALLAASRHPDVRRTLVQHGDHLFPYAFWLVTETQNFNCLLYSDPTVPADMQDSAAALGLPAPAFRYDAPRIREIRRRFGRPTGNAVVYVPTSLMGDSVGPDGTFDDAWYHRWHLRLLDVMTARTDMTFIWKGLPTSDQTVDPIPLLIAERQLTNVSYRAESFVRVLSQAARVITDFPSTALYETVHAGRPVLAISFERFARLRPSAAAAFAPVLRVCDGEEAALRHIDEFLDSPQDRWILPASVLDHA
jgi:hypothetical protein